MALALADMHLTNAHTKANNPRHTVVVNQVDGIVIGMTVVDIEIEGGTKIGMNSVAFDERLLTATNHPQVEETVDSDLQLLRNQTMDRGVVLRIVAGNDLVKKLGAVVGKFRGVVCSRFAYVSPTELPI
jgi:hypothetical protein